MLHTSEVSEQKRKPSPVERTGKKAVDQKELTRICRKCSVEYPIDFFFKNSKPNGGRAWTCRKCKQIRKTYLKSLHRQKGDNFGGNKMFALERDGFKCVLCGMTDKEHRSRWNRGITVDHIDGNGRNSKHKNHELSNLQTLCCVCHGKKDIRMRRDRLVKH